MRGIFNFIDPGKTLRYKFNNVTLMLLLFLWIFIDKKAIQKWSQKSYCNYPTKSDRTIIKFNHNISPKRLADADWQIIANPTLTD